LTASAKPAPPSARLYRRNVSFYNETLGKSIYPTPVIGVLGSSMTPLRPENPFREEGDIICCWTVLDQPQGADTWRPFAERRPRILLLRILKNDRRHRSGEPPAIDLSAEKRLIDCLVALAAEGSIQSAMTFPTAASPFTLAESCFATNGSAQTQKLEENGPAEAALFGERGARAVVSVTLAHLAVFSILRDNTSGAHEVGKVIRGDAFRIQYQGSAVIDSSTLALRDAWTNSLERTLKMQ